MTQPRGWQSAGHCAVRPPAACPHPQLGDKAMRRREEAGAQPQRELRRKCRSPAVGAQPEQWKLNQLH